MINVFRVLGAPDAETMAALRHRYFGYPDALPKLFRLRPPGGNRRPEGIAESYARRQSRDELPDMY
jgi:hypothetical protein